LTALALLAPHTHRVPTDTRRVRRWYDEISSPGYNFDSPGCGGGVGHFTQVVWKDSIKVGCGVKLNCGGGRMSMTSVVCNYDPRGNFNCHSQAARQIGRLVSSGACSSETANVTTQAVHAANENATSLEQRPLPRQLVLNLYHPPSGDQRAANSQHAMVPP
jgi:hypothetical protein